MLTLTIEKHLEPMTVLARTEDGRHFHCEIDQEMYYGLADGEQMTLREDACREVSDKQQ